MLIGFKQRFAPYVEDFSKTHTIRGFRDRPPVVGTRLDLYASPRQKNMRLLGRFACTKVEPITIMLERTASGPLVLVSIAGVLLSADESEQFAWRDGFREPGRASLMQLFDFWQQNDRPPLWHGQLIHWDPSKPMVKDAAVDSPVKAAKSRREACLLAAQAELAAADGLKGKEGMLARHAAEMRANRILSGCSGTRRLPAEFEAKIRKFQVVSPNSAPSVTTPVARGSF